MAATAAILFLSWLGPALLATSPCQTYEQHVRPLIERCDVKGLQRAFKLMNNETRSVATYRVLPIDNTVWPEVNAVRMLVSLSRPLLRDIGQTDAWPDNNNIRVFTPGAANVFSPGATYQGGLRYAYNCVTLHARSISRAEFYYDPQKPVFSRGAAGDVWVPRENVIAANGDTVDIQSTMRVTGFERLTVRECSARQVFYNASSADECFDRLVFFSLPEAVEARSASEDIADPNKFVPESLHVAKQMFLVLS